MKMGKYSAVAMAMVASEARGSVRAGLPSSPALALKTTNP